MFFYLFSWFKVLNILYINKCLIEHASYTFNILSEVNALLQPVHDFHNDADSASHGNDFYPDLQPAHDFYNLICSKCMIYHLICSQCMIYHLICSQCMISNLIYSILQSVHDF